MGTFQKTAVIGCMAFLAAGISNAASTPKTPIKNPYTLDMQAMQDVKKQTDVYVKVTSGSSGVAPADLAKHVQMKSFDTAGTLRWSKNEFNVPLAANAAKTGSATQFSYNDMGRYQPVQAQVQVQTGQSVSTEVLKTKVPVLLRPDLSVTEIKAKDSVHVGDVVNIAATIQELNGDLGAQASVSLNNGSTRIDGANGVSVAARGNSGVVFATHFDQPGTYTLTVRVDAANPGDYDSSNNQKDITIIVVAGGTPVPYQMNYHDTVQDYSYSSGGWWGGSSYSYKGEQQSTWAYLDLSGQNVVYPLKASINIRVDGNPTALVTKSVSGVYPDWSWSYDCYSGSSAFRDLGNNVYFYVSQGNYCGWYRYSHAQYTQYANDYVYFSQYHDYYWGSGSYSGTVKEGTFVRARESVQSRFVVEGGDGNAFGGEMTIPTLSTYSWDAPWNYNYGYYWSYGQNKGTQVYGYNSGISQ